MEEIRVMCSENEYERIRKQYLVKNIKALLSCLSLRLTKNEFSAIKEDLFVLVDDI